MLSGKRCSVGISGEGQKTGKNQHRVSNKKRIQINSINHVLLLTSSKTPGIKSTVCGEKPVESKMRCKTIAAMTAVIMDVQMRNASRYLRVLLEWNSNMK